MKRCECGCGGAVGPNRPSAARRRFKLGRWSNAEVRFLPGHQSRRQGGYGRGLWPPGRAS